ncbi:MAG: DUF1127 domain-containing protein [Hyphomicrobiales bacterium]
MAFHYIWMSTDPHLRGHLRRANEERSAAFYAAFATLRNGLAAGGDAVSRAFDWLNRRHKERVAISELYALDDRTLRDIGVPRGEIRSIARALADGVEEPRPRAVAMKKAARDKATEPGPKQKPAWLHGVVEGGGASATAQTPRQAGAGRKASVDRRDRAAGCG